MQLRSYKVYNFKWFVNKGYWTFYFEYKTRNLPKAFHIDLKINMNKPNDWYITNLKQNVVSFNTSAHWHRRRTCGRFFKANKKIKTVIWAIKAFIWLRYVFLHQIKLNINSVFRYCMQKPVYVSLIIYKFCSFLL